MQLIFAVFCCIGWRVTPRPGICGADTVRLSLCQILAQSAKSISRILDMKNTDFLKYYYTEVLENDFLLLLKAPIVLKITLSIF